MKCSTTALKTSTAADLQLPGLQHNCIQNFYCSGITTTAYCSTAASKISTAADLPLLHTVAQLHPKLPLKQIYNYCIL
jgi:hypothetical protein